MVNSLIKSHLISSPISSHLTLQFTLTTRPYVRGPKDLVLSPKDGGQQVRWSSHVIATAADFKRTKCASDTKMLNEMSSSCIPQI